MSQRTVNDAALAGARRMTSRWTGRSVSLSATDATRPVIDIRAVTPRRFYMGSRPYNAIAAIWDGPNFSAGTSVRLSTLYYWRLREVIIIIVKSRTFFKRTASKDGLLYKQFGVTAITIRAILQHLPDSSQV